MSKFVYVNGEHLKQEDACISVFDHGLLYGDGVFEGIRAYDGNIFKLTEHLERLYRSAKVINLRIPLEIGALEKAVIDIMKANGLRDAYIRLIVTRGVGDLGLSPDKCSAPTIIIIADKITLYPEVFYEQGLKIITASTRRNIPEALNPRIKSLNYLNNIMAKIEANNAGVPEALMLTRDGYVAECSGDNIFIISRRDVIFTPPPYLGTLTGITRETIIDISVDMGFEVKESPFTMFEVYNSKECFLTGTAAEVVPVIDCDGRPIGDGHPGQTTKELIKKFREIVRIEGTRIE
ncbi:MAG: branched-chain-amino-acid transaminase [Elusimicrobiota bacterium]